MLKKKIIFLLSIAGTFVSNAYADDNMRCSAEFAVSALIPYNENVAFNASNERGFNTSLTLRGGSEPRSIEKIPCSQEPLTIRATRYATGFANTFINPIGRCRLIAGNVFLTYPGNSVSVVFREDFICER